MIHYAIIALKSAATKKYPKSRVTKSKKEEERECRGAKRNKAVIVSAVTTTSSETKIPKTVENQTTLAAKKKCHAVCEITENYRK